MMIFPVLKKVNKEIMVEKSRLVKLRLRETLWKKIFGVYSDVNNKYSLTLLK